MVNYQLFLMHSKKGVIVLPIIFGLSKWYVTLSRILQKAGYQSIVIDPYKNQKFKQPFFITLVSGNEKQKLDTLASKFKVTKINHQIDQAVAELQSKGCSEIFLFGSSLGGVFALNYTQSHPSLIKGIITWYPNLLFPKNFPNSFDIVLPPEPTKIAIPIHIFMGEKDSKLEPGSLELAQRMAHSQQNITLDIYPNAGHAFWENTIQYFLPNIFYNKKASSHSMAKSLQLLETMSKVSI